MSVCVFDSKKRKDINGQVLLLQHNEEIKVQKHYRGDGKYDGLYVICCLLCKQHFCLRG